MNIVFEQFTNKYYVRDKLATVKHAKAEIFLWASTY